MHVLVGNVSLLPDTVERWREKQPWSAVMRPEKETR